MLRTDNFRVDAAQLINRIQAELLVPRKKTVTPAPAEPPAASQARSPAPAPTPTAGTILSASPDPAPGPAAHPAAPAPDGSAARPLRRSFGARLRDVPVLGSLAAWIWSLVRLPDTRAAAHTALTRASDAWNLAAARESWVLDREAQLRGQIDRELQADRARYRDLQDEFRVFRDELTDLRRELQGLGNGLQDVRHDGERDTAVLRAEMRSPAREIAALRSEVERIKEALEERRQEEQRIRAAEREFETRIARLHQEILFQQNRLADAMERRSVAPDHPRHGPAPGPSIPPRAGAVQDRLNNFYAQFEETFRGSREDIRNRVSVHADRVALTGAGAPDRPVLDIGCGRGEWLEVLEARGLAAYGIDTNDVTVSACRARGLDARRAEALDHLRSLADGSIGGVTAFHVAEHLPLDVLADLLDESLRVLRPGGVLLLETPNPENLLVGGMTFYNDPTHRNPLPPAMLEFLVRQRGFSDTEIVRLHPFPDDHLLPEDGEIGRRLNRLLYGPQDYAVVARKA